MESRTERKEQMKHLTIAATLILAGVIGYGVAAHAQPAGAGKADPVKVDPKHYKVEFENASVRVLRISYAPGEKSVMHYHPNAVAVYLTDGMTRMTTPDGKSQDMPSKAGETAWTPAGSHLPQNVGKTPVELILVELKK
jgi:quercetin dioxygenase-like cupin family protein